MVAQDAHQHRGVPGVLAQLHHEGSQGEQGRDGIHQYMKWKFKYADYLRPRGKVNSEYTHFTLLYILKSLVAKLKSKSSLNYKILITILFKIVDTFGDIPAPAAVRGVLHVVLRHCLHVVRRRRHRCQPHQARRSPAG